MLTRSLSNEQKFVSVVILFSYSWHNTAHGIAIAILFVSQMHVLGQNEIIVCQCLNTIQNRDISSLSTPTATGVAENCPLPPEIFASSDLSGLKCSADNYTVYFFDIGTSHSSCTVSLR